MIFGLKIFRLDLLFLLHQGKRKNFILIKKIAIATTRSVRPYTFKDYIPDIFNF
jgi:hypothetical protein